MSIIDTEYTADWRVGRTDLADFLAAWAKSGFTPQPPTPESLLTSDGRSIHRYRMVYAGLEGWNRGAPVGTWDD